MLFNIHTFTLYHVMDSNYSSMYHTWFFDVWCGDTCIISQLCLSCDLQRIINQLYQYRELQCMVWQYVYHQPIVLKQGLAMYGVAICVSDTPYHQPIVLIPLIVIAKSGPSLACCLTRHIVETENQKIFKTYHTALKNTKKEPSQRTICPKR